jgi:hypothetical protein
MRFTVAGTVRQRKVRLRPMSALGQKQTWRRRRCGPLCLQNRTLGAGGRQARYGPGAEVNAHLQSPIAAAKRIDWWSHFFAPMGRLDIDVPSTPSVDPIGSVLVTRKRERVDDTIIVQHADFEISIRWRYRGGLPFGGE